jgi:glycosyltransferase involved in cell wall biosynthesis
MIEVVAGGVLVIACRRGSVPEIIEDGLTGFLVQDIKEAVRTIDRLPQLYRVATRARFFNRFTARRMAEGYCVLYERLGFVSA